MLTSTSPLTTLLPMLGRLDQLLAQAAAAAQAAYGPEGAADPFRGLYISADEVARLLTQAPGAPLLAPGTNGRVPPAPADDSPLAWLGQAYGLTSFDLDLLLVALAPEIDLRYERVYAFLQNDVTRRRPTVDLALTLLCPSAQAKLARRAHLAADAPLLRHGLLHLLPDPNQLHPPFLAHYLKPDDQIVRVILDQEGLDARLAPFCRMVAPASGPGGPLPDPEIAQAVPTLVAQAQAEHRPLRLYFQGGPDAGARQAAEALAGTAGLGLLVVDLAGALRAHDDFAGTLRLVFREAWFQNAILYLDGLDAVREGDRAPQYHALLVALADDPGITILAGVQPWTPAPLPAGYAPLGVIAVLFPSPDFDQRREYWRATLAAEGAALAAPDLDLLAGRFRLSPGQIADAVATAGGQARWRAAAAGDVEDPAPPPTLRDLFAAARAQTGHDLAALARKIAPLYTWDDIVLPADALAQLREICRRVAAEHRVLDEWGFGRKLSQGKGVTVLFAGPSGTGKTMAAEIIANALGLDLYKIDLAGVVSKYIGETEKNLDRIFTAATQANAILFFDEADALFGKRSEVRDSHDRYANIEIAYLLQKMEQYDGIAILATNLRGNLDDAFTRRLAFTIYFPFPEEADRRRIWAGVWPAAVPLAADLDLEFLTRRFKLSGGHIKNIALAAAFLAAEDGMVTMDHVLQALRREYQKMGKLLSAAELAPDPPGGSA